MNEIPHKLVQFINSQLKLQFIPGLSISITGDLEYTNCFGFAQSNTKSNFSNSTMFEQCSLTKQFAGFAVGILVHNGVIRWDQPISEYCDIRFMLEDVTKNITILDLLGHKVGLGKHNMIWKGMDTHLDASQYLIPNLQYLEFLDNHERYVYSNLTYCIVAYIVSKLSKMPFTEFVDKHILDPCGIIHTWNTEDFIKQDHANPHMLGGSVEKFLKIDPYNCDEYFENNIVELEPFIRSNPLFCGCGGLYCSSIDMAKWMRVILNKGKNDRGQQILHELSVIFKVNNSFSSSSRRIIQKLGYCVGLNKSCLEGYNFVEHSGSNYGLSTWMRVTISGERKFGIHVAMNADYTSFPFHLLNYATALLLKHQQLAENSMNAVKSSRTRYCLSLLEMFAADGATLNPVEIANPELLVGTYEHKAYGLTTIIYENSFLYLKRSPEPPRRLWETDTKWKFYCMNRGLTTSSWSFRYDEHGLITLWVIDRTDKSQFLEVKFRKVDL